MCGSSRALRIGLRPQSPQGPAYNPKSIARGLLGTHEYSLAKKDFVPR